MSDMFTSVLIEAGLSPDDAKVYEALLVGGTQTVAQVYSKVRPIKRTTLYQVLRRLVERGFVREAMKQGKTVFSPEPPEALVQATENESRALERRKAAIVAAMSKLKEKYALAAERPVIRFHDGADGLKDIYDAHLASGAKEVRFVRAGRARANDEVLGNWWAHYLRRRREKKIKAIAITADDPKANHDLAKDAFLGISRSWVRPEDYDAPVEFDIYGDTVAIISFGKEIFGITLENALLAKAFRDLFELARRGAKTVDVTHDHDTE